MNKLLSLIILVVFLQAAQAQSSFIKDAIGFRAIMVDYQGPYDGNFDNFQNYKTGFEFFYSRNIYPNLNLSVPLRAGTARFTETLENSSFIGLDLQLQYAFNRVNKPVTPYLFLGIGGVMDIPGDFRAEVPLGGGLDIRLHEKVMLNTFLSYRYGTSENTSSFQHGIGFKFLIGQTKPKEIKDKDGDGVPDHLDDCPTIPGLAQFNGCPDTDGDGIPDHKDDCPTFAGLKEFNGCPDTDGDGVPDHLDACPTVPGPKENKGCPLGVEDSDGDGIPDDEDKCPDEYGLPQYDGCPDTDGDGVPDHLDDCPTVPGDKLLRGCPDSDGDGVPDYLDKCPDLPGPARNSGCPELKKEEKAILDNAMRAVQFDLNSANLKPQSFTVLDQIVGLMRKYPQYSISIEGHTDTTGTPERNQTLSDSRARACYDYLVQKGIPANRMSSKGFGQNRPLYDNETEEGRKANRRVEFIMTVQ